MLLPLEVLLRSPFRPSREKEGKAWEVAMKAKRRATRKLRECISKKLEEGLQNKVMVGNRSRSGRKRKARSEKVKRWNDDEVRVPCYAESRTAIYNAFDSISMEVYAAQA